MDLEELARMAAGLAGTGFSQDRAKAKIIHEFTRFLPAEQAAQADAILAAAAPGMAPAELKKKAARCARPAPSSTWTGSAA
jgi:hypothetical protein